MSEVSFDVAVSIDGFIAGPNVIQQALDAGLIDERPSPKRVALDAAGV